MDKPDDTSSSETSTEDKALYVMEPLSADAYALFPDRLTARLTALSEDLLRATSAEPGVGAAVSEALRWAAAPLSEQHRDGISVAGVETDTAWDRGFIPGFHYVVAITAAYLDSRLDDPQTSAGLGRTLHTWGTLPGDVTLGSLIEREIRGAMVLRAAELERSDEGFALRVRAVLDAIESARSTFAELAGRWDQIRPGWRDATSEAEPWRQVVVGGGGVGVALLGCKHCWWPIPDPR